MEKDESKRLTDPEKIKNHPWFKGISWSDLIMKKTIPPFVPEKLLMEFFKLSHQLEKGKEYSGNEHLLTTKFFDKSMTS